MANVRPMILSTDGQAQMAQADVVLSAGMTNSGGTITLTSTTVSVTGNLNVTGTETITSTTSTQGDTNLGNDTGDTTTITGDLGVSLPGNVSNAFRAFFDTTVDEDYFVIDTVDASEAMKFGNALTDPTYTFQGSGGVTIDAGGLTVTAGGATVTAGGLTVTAGTSQFDDNVDLGATTADTVTVNGLVDSNIVFDTTSRTITSTVPAVDTAASDMTYTGAAGGAASSGTGGVGSDIDVLGGTGGAGSAALVGGAGGTMDVLGGIGGLAGASSAAGAGGAVAFAGGVGGDDNGASSTSGVGGDMTVSGGAAGSQTLGTGANGGDVDINGGNASGGGTDGSVNIGASNTTAISFGAPLTLTSGIFNLTDNVADALDIQQGSDNYININTTNASEAMQFGSSGINPTYDFLGSGGVTVAAGGITVTAGGLTVTAGGLTVTAGAVDLTGGSTVDIVSGVNLLIDGAASTADFTKSNWDECWAFFAATDITGAEAEELSDGSPTVLHTHSSAQAGSSGWTLSGGLAAKKVGYATTTDKTAGLAQNDGTATEARAIGVAVSSDTIVHAGEVTVEATGTTVTAGDVMYLGAALGRVQDTRPTGDGDYATPMGIVTDNLTWDGASDFDVKMVLIIQEPVLVVNP